jgi:alkylresorcinol/alkylpyrone synthase
MTSPAALQSLATAVPPHILRQSDVADASRELFAGRFDGFERMARIFGTAGIVKRHAAMPIDWYQRPLGWPERNAAFLAAADELFVEAAGRALEDAGLKGRDVDTVVTATSTGIATPGVEARVLTRMGFREDVLRVPVFGLGCAAGVSGLSIASRLAEARPGTNVLFVTIELCTLSFRLDKLTKANMVATALFGDGAAACVLRAGDGGIAEVGGGDCHTWPDTLDIMGWSVDPEGLGVIFAQAIPPFAEANLGPAMAGMLDRLDIERESVDRMVCHPGGTKVINALERAFELDQGTLDHERDVIADYGNMSAPTVLFVLERVLAAGANGRLVLSALGPGFTSACLALQVA